MNKLQFILENKLRIMHSNLELVIFVFFIYREETIYCKFWIYPQIEQISYLSRMFVILGLFGVKDNVADLVRY